MKLFVVANVSIPDGIPERSAKKHLAEIGVDFVDKMNELFEGLGIAGDLTISDTDSPIAKIVETEDENVGLIVEQNASFYRVTGKGD